MKLPEKRVTIGATRTFGERSLIPVVESISFQRKDAFFGKIDLKALVVIEGDDSYLLPLEEGITLDQVCCQVPELRERIEQERLAQGAASSEPAGTR
jgi:hypothetical protein